MSKFPDWFKRAYKQWSQSQPGEEDFLAFCDLLGYAPAIVLNWLQGEAIPQGAELLSIAGVLGTKVYEILGQAAPDPELVKIYNSFSHLNGEPRSKLALALYEVELRLKAEKLSVKSNQAKKIFEVIFANYGLNKSQ